MTERTLRISARMAEEIQQWASDELSQWPRDTAYAADLESLLAQLTAAQPAPDAVADADPAAWLYTRKGFLPHVSKNKPEYHDLVSVTPLYPAKGPSA